MAFAYHPYLLMVIVAGTAGIAATFPAAATAAIAGVVVTSFRFVFKGVGFRGIGEDFHCEGWVQGSLEHSYC